MAKEIHTLPIYWASYLINGDSSGMDENEIKEIDAYLSKYPHHYCIGVQECGFQWRNDANNLGAECGDFVFYFSI